MLLPFFHPFKKYKDVVCVLRSEKARVFVLTFYFVTLCVTSLSIKRAFPHSFFIFQLFSGEHFVFRFQVSGWTSLATDYVRY